VKLEVEFSSIRLLVGNYTKAPFRRLLIFLESAYTYIMVCQIQHASIFIY